MNSFTFGCQTYTWQMSFDKYKGRLPSILDAIRDSGFKGVEAEVCMLGDYYQDAGKFNEALQHRGLELAALTLAEPWLEMNETEEERKNADYFIQYLRKFPESKLILVQLPMQDRSNLAARQKSALACANAVAERAVDAGITVSFHPNSPLGSVFRTAEDYEVLFANLDRRFLGYCPDSGHIANGGMDVERVFKENINIINHVHFKDFDCYEGNWTQMGKGSIDHSALVNILRSSGYSGWVMVEEESEFGRNHPERAALDNAAYVQHLSDSML